MALTDAQLDSVATAVRLPDRSLEGTEAAWDVVLGRVRAQQARYGTDGAATPAFDALIAVMERRDRLGAEKYGMRLRPYNGQDPLREALQEALDLCAYLANEATERPDLVGSMNLDMAIHLALQLMRRYLETRGERA